MVINGVVFNNIIHNLDNGRELESYCKAEKLSLIELRRTANENSEKSKIGIVKRCTTLINKLLH